jgi:MFS family permease
MKANYGKILMWAAIIVSMPRWAGAFISADVSDIPHWVNEALHYGNLIAGFGMGFLEVLAAAYMLDAWGKMKPKASWNAKSYDHKWKILTGFIIGLFVLMPLILAPYIVSRMTAVTIGEALKYSFVQYLWSIAVVLSPAFIVGGVSVANGELVENETEKKPKQETKTKPIETKIEKQKRETTKPVSPEVEELSGTKKLVFLETKRNPDATQQEIAEMLQEKHGVSVSRQMVGKHQRSLNGALK